METERNQIHEKIHEIHEKGFLTELEKKAETHADQYMAEERKGQCMKLFKVK